MKKEKGFALIVVLLVCSALSLLVLALTDRLATLHDVAIMRRKALEQERELCDVSASVLRTVLQHREELVLKIAQQEDLDYIYDVLGDGNIGVCLHVNILPAGHEKLNALLVTCRLENADSEARERMYLVRSGEEGAMVIGVSS